MEKAEFAFFSYFRQGWKWLLFFSEAVFSYQSVMEMIPDWKIEHPLIIHEDGRVEIECGIRKERSHKYEQPMKKLHSLFR